jgi:Ca-activated chloride channel family protein
LAANFVGGITADGGTDRFAALKQAFAYRPDVIFFLSDADDPMSPSEMADISRLQSRVGTAICVIEFGRSATVPKQNFLIELARQSGGQYGYVNTASLKP